MGKEKLLSFGAYPILPFAGARRMRDEAKARLADGHDPLVQTQLDRIEGETKARITFEAVADEYYQSLQDSGRAPAALRKKRWHIDDLVKPIHNRPIDQFMAA